MAAVNIRMVSILFLAVAILAPPRVNAADETAQKIADQMMEALGGRDRWDHTRFVHFRFSRQGKGLEITWDRFDGRYRLEATNDAGVPFVVVMNLQTRQGNAALDGRALEGAELSEYLNRAAHMWAGETYWLLMPYKLRDPGVALSYEGEETVGGVVYDKLHLSFEKVGFTPGDQFTAYVNRSTHLMDRWQFKLESGFAGDFQWSNWQRFGGILLATERTGPKGEKITFDNIIVSDSLPDEVFTSLQPVKLP
jgi:hypothetical protein